MTDDLVKRLRQIGEGAYVGAVSDDRKAAREAADRIEKLEAELHSCFYRIEELQGALREIVEQEPQTAHPVVVHIIAVARKALEGKDD
jgi:hypothetical protein